MYSDRRVKQSGRLLWLILILLLAAASLSIGKRRMGKKN